MLCIMQRFDLPRQPKIAIVRYRVEAILVDLVWENSNRI